MIAQLTKCPNHSDQLVSSICIKKNCKLNPLCCSICSQTLHIQHVTGGDFIQIEDLTKCQVLFGSPLSQEIKEIMELFIQSKKKFDQSIQQLNLYGIYQSEPNQPNLFQIAKVIKHQDTYSKYLKESSQSIKGSKEIFKKVFDLIHQQLQWIIKQVKEISEDRFELQIRDKGINQIKQLLEQNKFQESIQIANSLLDQDQNQSNVLSLKAKAIIGLNQSDEALSLLELAIELDNKNKYAYQYKGQLLVEQKLFRLAIETLNKAISIDNQLQMAFYWKAAALKELNRVREAQQAIEQSIALQTNKLHVQSYILKINLLVCTDCYQEALELSQFIKKKTNNKEIDILYSLSDVLIKYELLLKKKIIEYQHLNKKQLIEQILSEQKNYNQYFEVILYKQLHQLYTQDIEIIKQLIQQLMKMQRFEECIEYINEIYSFNNKESDIELELIRARCLFKIDEDEKALKLINELLEKDQNNIPLLNQKVAILMYLNREQEALQSCEMILQLDNDNVDALNYKCQCLFSSQPEECYKIAKKLISIAPNDSQGYSQIAAYLFLHQKNKNQAQLYIQQALNLNGEDSLAIKILELLQNSQLMTFNLVDIYIIKQDKQYFIQQLIMQEQEIELFKCEYHPALYVQNICIKKGCKLSPLCCQFCQNNIHSNHTTGIDFIPIDSFSSDQVLSDNDLFLTLNEFNSESVKKIKGIESMTQKLNIYQSYITNPNKQNLKMLAKILKNKELYEKFRKEFTSMMKNGNNLVAKFMDEIYSILEGIVEWIEDFKESNLQRISQLIQENKFQESIDSINQISKKYTDQNEFKQLLVESLIGLNKCNEAELIVQELLSKNENNKQILCLKGQILIKQNQFKLSINWLDKAIQLDPNYQIAYYWKATALFNSFRYRQAQEIIQLSIDNENQQKHISSYILQIKILLKLDHFADAFRISSSLIDQTHNQEIQELNKLAKECDKLQEYLIKLQYNNTKSCINQLPNVLQEKKELLREIILIKHTLNLNIKNLKLLKNLISLLFTDQRYEECIEYINILLKQEVQETLIEQEILKAQCLFKLDEQENNQKLINILIEKYQQNCQNLNVIARQLKQQNQQDEALKLCEKILEIDHRDYEALKLKCTLIYVQDPIIANSITDILIQINQKDSFGYGVKALCYLKMGDIEEARICAVQAMTLNKEDLNALQVLGIIDQQLF